MEINWVYFIFVPIYMVFLAVFLVYGIKSVNKIKEILKKQNEFNFNLDEFKSEFDIECESCNKVFNTRLDNCPYCGTPYGNNLQYKELKKKYNVDYYDYVLENEKKLQDERNMYHEAMKVIRLNPFIDYSLFSFDIKEYKLEEKNEFSICCEYCNTKIDTNINGEGSCPNCKALCKDNIEVKINKELNKYSKNLKEYVEELNKLKLKSNERATKKAKFLTKYNTAYIVLFFIVSIILCLLISHIILYLFNLLNKDIQNIILISINEIPSILLALFLLIVYLKYKKKR